MKLNERAVAAPNSFKAKARLWQPDLMVTREGEDSHEPLPAETGDCYAAVDDIGAGVVVLRVSRWPRVDAFGRLAFPKRAGFPTTIHMSRDAFQAIIDRDRTFHLQTAPTRELRVGDVFLVRGMTGDEISTAVQTWDVSAAGRDMAKAAYYGAGAATVDESYIRKMGTGMGAPAVQIAEADPPGTFLIHQQAAPADQPGARK